MIMSQGASVFHRAMLNAASDTIGNTNNCYLLATLTLLLHLLCNTPQPGACALALFGDKAKDMLISGAKIACNVATRGLDSSESTLQTFVKAVQFVTMVMTTNALDGRRQPSLQALLVTELRTSGCVPEFHSMVKNILLQLTDLSKQTTEVHTIHAQMTISCIGVFLTMVNCDSEHCECTKAAAALIDSISLSPPSFQSPSLQLLWSLHQSPDVAAAISGASPTPCCLFLVLLCLFAQFSLPTAFT